MSKGRYERVMLADFIKCYGPTYRGSVEIVGLSSSRREMVLGSLPKRILKSMVDQQYDSLGWTISSTVSLSMTGERAYSLLTLD